MVVDADSSDVMGRAFNAKAMLRAKGVETLRATSMTSGPMPSPGKVVKRKVFITREHP